MLGTVEEMPDGQDLGVPMAEGRITGLAIETAGIATIQTIRQPCNAPAPLVLNGGPYAGCTLERDHDGAHELRITWSSR